MRCLTFVVCSLVAAALAVNAQTSTAPANLDHFNCYLAPGPPQPQLAILKDQFDAAAGTVEFIQDLRMVLFCNPVQKAYNGAITKILHPADHLAMYLIPPEPMVPRVVTVQNQFGVQSLVTRRAEILAVPSGKSVITSTTPPQLPPIPNPKELDHFKCYGASGQSINALVSLQDQFLNFRTRVMEPILFCNPVEKTVVAAGNPNSAGVSVADVDTTTISNATGHLTCYTEVPTPFQSVVVYNNQFAVPGTLPTVAIRNAEILCVPSLKLKWSVITTNTTGTGAAGAN